MVGGEVVGGEEADCTSDGWSGRSVSVCRFSRIARGDPGVRDMRDGWVTT